MEASGESTLCETVVSGVGLAQLSWTRQSAICAPAYFDQVKPVAVRNSIPRHAHVPMIACRRILFGRPVNGFDAEWDSDPVARFFLFLS